MGIANLRYGLAVHFMNFLLTPRTSLVATMAAAALLIPSAAAMAASAPAPAPTATPTAGAVTPATAPAPAAKTPAGKPATPATAPAGKSASTPQGGTAPAATTPKGSAAPATTPAATPTNGAVPAQKPAPLQVTDEGSGSSLLSMRNILLAALLAAVLAGFAFVSRSKRGASHRDAAADEQEAATHAAVVAADTGAEAAGVAPKKRARFALRGKAKAAEEAEAMDALDLQASPPADLPQPVAQVDNVLAMPGHEQWAQPGAPTAAAGSPAPLAPPAPAEAELPDAFVAPGQPTLAAMPQVPAPEPTAPVAPLAVAAPVVQPAPLTLEGTVPQGQEAPGEWIEIENEGNVVFQLSFSDGVPLEVLFADADGTWFQVPPMDPASGAVALPLDAGRYYVQLRDPAQRNATYRLVIWPPAMQSQLAPTAQAPLEQPGSQQQLAA